ncbi:MAG TPA: DUF998 domain-containing protein [Actinomycetes bacterium]|nr:DUF998 domain-containing protein [Actinomycetes bacterium]
MNHTPQHSQQAAGPRSRRLALLATLAIVGQVALVASAMLLPLWSEYDLVGDNISELALGQHGFVQTAAFVVAGLGTLGLAFALRGLLRRLWGSQAGSVLVAIYGVAAILAAIFPADRIDRPADVTSLSTTGTIHVLVAWIGFLSIIAGMFVLTMTFARVYAWRWFSRWSVVLPASALALLSVQSQGPRIGLMQRLLVGVIAAWLILVASKVHALAARGPQAPRPRMLDRRRRWDNLAGSKPYGRG